MAKRRTSSEKVSNTVTLAALAALGLAGAANADTLFDNPYVFGNGGDCSFSTTCAAANMRGDDFAAQEFTLTVPEVVTSASFTELDMGVTPTAVNWGFALANGPGGLPGAFLSAGTNSVASTVNLGMDGGSRVTQVYFGVGPQALAAGTYYFALQGVSSTVDTRLGFGMLPSGAAETHDGGVTWAPNYELVPPATSNSVAVSLYGTPTTGWNFNPAWPTTPPPARGDSFEGFTGFEVFLPGDQRNIVDVTGTYNSFNNPTTIVTYDPVSNQTLVEFTSSTGDRIPLGPGPGNFGPGHLAAPHFGFVAGIPGQDTGGEMLPPVKMQWVSASPPTEVPGLGVDFRSAATVGTWEYLIEYVNATADGMTTGNWHEFMFRGGAELSFLGSTDVPVTLSLAEYRISSTFIPLDDLNTDDLPPTGPGWTSMALVPDGTVLAPGETLFALSVPEPATWGMMLAGFGLAGATLRRRRAMAA